MIEVKITVGTASELNKEIAVLAQRLSGGGTTNLSFNVEPLELSGIEASKLMQELDKQIGIRTIKY